MEAAVERKRARKMTPPDMAFIVARVKKVMANGVGITEACEAVALELGREPGTIYSLMHRLAPTTDIAQAYLQSSALRLAMRVVREANVSESVDILGRKNMGVLSPKQEESAGQGGFFLSVQAESCGAVKVGVMVGSGAQRQEGRREAPALTGASIGEPEFYQSIDVQAKEVTDGQSKPVGQQGHIRQLGEITDRQAKAIESARERLKVAQRKRGRELRRQRRAQPETPESE